VAAGPPGLGSDDTIQLVRRLGLEDSVRFTGYIDHEDLAPLIAGAAGLVHPAADEGFGMVPLEGMACGIPTAVSNAGALPEVVGDAALLIDPHDSTQWADAIARLLGDDGLRADLIERGRARAQLFTWPRAALETIAVHREVLHV
jgi:glycosyltransferase involved in cell wall biosynthesis